MSITVEGLLTLGIFKDARLLTNKSTANRIVKSVSVSDCPLYEDLIEENIFSYGDFFISSLNLYRNNPGSLMKAVEIMISAKSSGLCITDEYYADLPFSIIDVCNQAGFPVIQVSKNLPYAIIIRQITESIISDQSSLIKVNTLNELLNGNNSNDQKVLLIDRLNPYFKSCLLVLFITDIDAPQHKDAFIDSVNEHKTWTAIPFSHGILVISTFAESDAEKRSKKFSEATSYLVDQAYALGNPVIGISSRYEALHRIDEAIREALFAVKSSPYTRERILQYDKLGSIRLLIALKDHRELANYYDLTIRKILDYDKSNNASLFDTLQAFIRNDGDFKQTAMETHQHENTIRYRINQIRRILNIEESNIQFLETISMGVKIHDVLNF